MSSLQVRTNRHLTEQNAPEVFAFVQNCEAKGVYQSMKAFEGKTAAIKHVAKRFNVAPNVVNAAAYYW